MHQLDGSHLPQGSTRRRYPHPEKLPLQMLIMHPSYLPVALHDVLVLSVRSEPCCKRLLVHELAVEVRGQLRLLPEELFLASVQLELLERTLLLRVSEGSCLPKVRLSLELPALTVEDEGAEQLLLPDFGESLRPLS